MRLTMGFVKVAEGEEKGKLPDMRMNETPDTLKTFTGGIADTNAYLYGCPEGNILIDAPEGTAEAFQGEKISLLFLTHGHFDHVWDAAKIARLHGCPVFMHTITETMMADKNLLRRFGMDLEVEPLAADRRIGEGSCSFLGRDFEIFEVPGHCPGSLCLYTAGEEGKPGTLFGGDVLFAGGVGRWDLPGGDRDLLISGIQNKLLPLPSETIVHAGHGPSTTIGREKTGNPYLQQIIP